MGRRRIAASLQSLARNYSHHFLAVPLPRCRVDRRPWSLRMYDATDSLSREYVAINATTDGRVSEVLSMVEKIPALIPTRWPVAQRLEMSTVAATSIAPSEYQRVARSHPSLISTSGRSRACCYEQRCGHTSGQDFEGKEKISVTFVDKDGEETKIQVPEGMSMLEAAHENDIELEGACEGSLACSTCHVIVMDEDMYTKLPEPSDEENDMLDLAFGLTETSRLGCQVLAKPELDGMHLALPAATRNFAVDGHVPKPH